MTLKVAVLLSGNGSTLQNILDRAAAGELDARVVCVVASRADALNDKLALPFVVLSACSLPFIGLGGAGLQVGQLLRSHKSYSNGPPTGRWLIGIGGVHGSLGTCAWRPATPSNVTSRSAFIASATRIAATPVPPGTRCQHCSRV